MNLTVDVAAVLTRFGSYSSVRRFPRFFVGFIDET